MDRIRHGVVALIVVLMALLASGVVSLPNWAAFTALGVGGSENNGETFIDGAFQGRALAENLNDTPDNGTPDPTPDNNSPDNDLPVVPPVVPPGDNSFNPNPGQTTLGSVICPGLVVLPVHGVRGFKAGDVIRINSRGATQEDATVADVDCAGNSTLSLTGPLKYRHGIGETVVVVTDTSSGAQGAEEREVRDRPDRQTETQRQQRERTNRSGLDDYRTEGNIVEVRCDEPTREIVIAMRDGRQTIRLVGEAASQCDEADVGKYLEADGTKVTEQVFEANSIAITRP